MQNNRNWHRTMKGAGRLASVILLAGSGLLAQTAKITGTVKDAAGKPLGGAKIEYTGEQKGARGLAASGENGAFVLPQVEPDTYAITASLADYSDYTATVQVGVGQTRDVAIVLNPASESTVVAIDNRGTTMDLGSARLGINVTGQELGAVPVNGRTWAPLAFTAPGASNAGDGSAQQLRIQGKSAWQNRFTYDGVDAGGVLKTIPGWLEISDARFRLQNSVEGLQEFRIDSGLYPAESGSAAGGQIHMISKSGGSAWRGDLFEYFRHDKLQAPNFDDGQSSHLRMNQFGANGGGPLWKNRLYAFGSFEGLRQRTDLTVEELTLSAAARAMAVPAVQPLLSAFPTGQTATADPLQDRARRVAGVRLNETTFIGRLDYTLSASHRVFLRYFKEAGSLDAPDRTISDRWMQAGNNPDNMVVSYSGTFGTSVSNDLKLGLNRAPTALRSFTGAAGLESTLITFGGSAYTSGGGITFPGGTTGTSPIRGAVSAEDYRPKSYNLIDNLTWLRGTHAVKAGFEFRGIRAPISFDGGLLFSFPAVAAFLHNDPSVVVYFPDMPVHVAEQEHYSAFAQDEWRPRQNLTLNFGVRYDYYAPTRERDGRTRLFDIGIMDYRAAGSALYQADRFGFSPRAGLAWSPRALKGSTVVRLGAGLYSGPGNLLDTMLPIFNDAEVLVATQQKSYPFSVPAFLSSGSGVRISDGIDYAGFKVPERNIQFGASIQQQLPFKVVAQAAYTGSLGRRLLTLNSANPAIGVTPFGTALRADWTRAAIKYASSAGSSNYHGLQLTATRRFVDGLTTGMAYSWSHAIGNTPGSGDIAPPQDPACLACERANLAFDVRHSLAATMVYDLPIGKGGRYWNQGPLSKALANWSGGAIFNARTGLPIDVRMTRPDVVAVDQKTGKVVSAGGPAPAGSQYVLNTIPSSPFSIMRPDLVPGVDPYLKKGGLSWLNPAAFATPQPGTYGNYRPNSLRGPGFAQVDLMISRQARFGERQRITFRAEVFNLFNRANYANPSSTLPNALPQLQPGAAYSSETAPGFGELMNGVGKHVGLGTPRQIQLGLRYSF